MFGFAPFGAAPFGGIPTAAVTPIVLVCEAGSLTLSGQPAGFRIGMPAEAGAYALTGQPAFFALAMPAAVGAYALTGQPAPLRLTMPVEAGSYVLTGYDANLFQNIVAGFIGSGEAAAEFVGTTRFALLLEDPDALMSYAAEIRLRSL